MSTFIIKVCKYEGSPVFDLQASGHNVSAVEIAEERGSCGTKQVYVFETKNDAELDLTIKKVRGDVEIEVPWGWGVDTDVIGYNDFRIRLPQVVLLHGDCERTLLGYIASQHMKVHFYKMHERVSITETGEKIE